LTPKPKAVVFADDLTGALECGAFLAHTRASVSVQPRPPQPGLAAAVINTATRHLPPDQAASRLLHLAQNISATLCFKKTDSTLRGNIPAELAALMQAFPHRPLIYAPAYPSLGRTVHNGCLLLNGVPLHQTDFARDPLNPVLWSSIPDLLRPYAEPTLISSPAHLRRLVPTLYLCDAATDDDMSAIAQIAAHSGALTAGPAGFLHALVPFYDLPRHKTSPTLTAKNLLLINGSLHPHSRRQAAHARTLGVKVLETPSSPATVTADQAAQASANLATQTMEASFDALIIFGGDTAQAILNKMDVHALQPAGELLPGIPVSRFRWQSRHYTLVTKAGGFGDPDVVSQIAAALQAAS
jgi:uncharacterized protein YgbK (DUF1537 family)